MEREILKHLIFKNGGSSSKPQTQTHESREEEKSFAAPRASSPAASFRWFCFPGWVLLCYPPVRATLAVPREPPGPLFDADVPFFS